MSAMKGEVLSLHDGFHLDVVQVKPIPPRARVQVDSGMTLMVDERMKWERDAGSLAKEPPASFSLGSCDSACLRKFLGNFEDGYQRSRLKTFP